MAHDTFISIARCKFSSWYSFASWTFVVSVLCSCSDIW